MSWISDVKHEMDNLDVSRKKLRQFGIVIGIIFALVVIWYYYPDPIQFIGYFTLLFSLFLILGGIFFPFGLKPLYKIWMGFAFFLGWFVSRIILTLLFLFVITPISIIAKLFGKQFINLEFKGNSTTYWIKKGAEKINYEKMY